MSIAKRAKEFLKDLLLGKIRPPRKFFLAQERPQNEVAVWLCGFGAPLDVTNRHSMACARPLTICVAFDSETVIETHHLEGLSLRFCEKHGRRRLLGRIGLRYTGISTPTSGLSLHFFGVASARSYCLPLLHLAMSYLLFAYRNWRHPLPPNTITLSFKESRALDVIFICPRPIGLASAQVDSRGNMFPLNVMGQLGKGYVGFALQDAKSPAHLVDHAGRIALSIIPMRHGDLAYKIGRNHSKKNGIEWSDLPFPTKSSPHFGIPIPGFALRVLEMEVELQNKLGTHTFFVGRVVADNHFSDAPELCAIHGHYQAWRLKSRCTEIQSSFSEDARVKRGLSPQSGSI
jgi:flavin reductase (DIM6/NTAB) family NADH-FMN oxidoreductase RutF